MGSKATRPPNKQSTAEEVGEQGLKANNKLAGKHEVAIRVLERSVAPMG